MELAISWQYPTDASYFGDVTLFDKAKAGKWQMLDLKTIDHMPVKHACTLFSNTKIPVIAKQDGAYVVNTEDLKARYRKSGKTVTMFQTLLDSGSALQHPISDRGFIQ